MRSENERGTVRRTAFVFVAVATALVVGSGLALAKSWIA